jgi:hypothetical protein
LDRLALFRIREEGIEMKRTFWQGFWEKLAFGFQVVRGVGNVIIWITSLIGGILMLTGIAAVMVYLAQTHSSVIDAIVFVIVYVLKNGYSIPLP